ncbi:MAG: hypothetical protein K2H63_01495 [Paramuribaculum sp.]|nr:hypothetical protein [Paramuribaculum sp.]
MGNKERKGSPAIIILIAVIIVGVVSLAPLKKWSNGQLKDFSLVSDILYDSLLVDDDVADDSVTLPDVDPALLIAMKTDTLIGKTVKTENSDSLITEECEEEEIVLPEPIIVERTDDGVLPIEDYSPSGNGLGRLRAALNSWSLARIAVVGDSYIEGDIFTQDVREKLQSIYGGSGVGYMSMHSEFPGFRRSVRQSGKGWKIHIAGKSGSLYKYMGLWENYFTSQGNAFSQYKGSSTPLHVDSWTVSKFLFIAPNDCRIKLKANDVELEYEITGSENVQEVKITNPGTTDFSLSVSSSTIIGLGVWLNSENGVSVDCMSSRGFSGVTLASISKSISAESRQMIDYDLIILEFGINALTAKQKDYSVYCNRMVDVINHLKSCYPNADFLLMGIGDRGQKKGTSVKSMTTVQNMIEAQRTAARTTGCLFWDTRAAMGGEDAIVEWSRKGMANKDYIHLTHKGGEALADEFVKALRHSLK